jgi:hypothetical protein
MQYAIAFVVFCHGFIYVRIGSALPGAIAEWSGGSWLLGGAVVDPRLTTLIVGLHVIAGIGTLATAVAMGLAPQFPGWWRPLAIGSAAIGIAAFAVFWDGQTQFLFQEGAIGAVISLTLLMGAMAFPGAFE